MTDELDIAFDRLVQRREHVVTDRCVLRIVVANGLLATHSTAVLCGMLKGNFPAGEDEYGRMAIECTGKNNGAFYPQIDPAALNHRDGRL